MMHRYADVVDATVEAALSAEFAVSVWDSWAHSPPEKVRDAARWAAEAANNARKAEEALP
jgi:hypothetical protein